MIASGTSGRSHTINPHPTERTLHPEHVLLPPEAEAHRELLDCEDAVFIQRAYLLALRRDADPDGFTNYLGRLRRGGSRQEVLAELVDSAEGRGNPDHAQVAALAAGMASARQAPELVSGAALQEWHRLPALQGRAFVAAAYRALLGREPDMEGMGHYLERLRSGEARTSILAHLRDSEECRRRARAASGDARDGHWLRVLDRQILVYRLANLPVLGALVRLFVRAEADDPLHASLRRIECALAEPRWAGESGFAFRADPAPPAPAVQAASAGGLAAAPGGREREVPVNIIEAPAQPGRRSAASTLRTLATPPNWGQEGEHV